MGMASGDLTRAWMNPRSYQILCPGLDGFFSPCSSAASKGGVYLLGTESKDKNGRYAPIYPDGLNYGTNTQDDITNFSNGKLSDDTQ